MKKKWDNVTKEHAVQAITKFNNEQVKAPKARSTHLIYMHQTLPAKHIRGMAYEIANKEAITKDEYLGDPKRYVFLKT